MGDIHFAYDGYCIVCFHAIVNDKRFKPLVATRDFFLVIKKYT